jgi:hypothetical protein
MKFLGQMMEGPHTTPVVDVAGVICTQRLGHLLVVGNSALHPALLILVQPVGHKNLDGRAQVTPLVLDAGVNTTNPAGHVVVATRFALQPPFTRVQPVAGQPWDVKLLTQKTPGRP